MSLAFVPTLTLEDTQLITIIAALAVKEALSTLYHLHVDIKWLNDIYVHGKKLAGILTEGENHPRKQSIPLFNSWHRPECIP
ncbi:hypothetical protein [Erysipelothrix piscisicarius]|uniref:hypothetical protein n=1 Tax=Erysipelothrix piscisicarius TaxID=2485784 RepID=UPI002F941DDB